ncbi:MAG: Com family DNA-binding transcriptional regulator [Proteobacteria bacterium]|nr:Com family DNA-binding transcriptional regulator [Pseudomonadota bacterium]
MEKEIRCGNCNRLLARGEALALTIKCPRCGCMNHVRATSPSVEGHHRASQECSRGHQPETVSSAEDQ